MLIAQRKPFAARHNQATAATPIATPRSRAAREIVQRATSCACGGTCPRCTARPNPGAMWTDAAPQVRLAVGAVDDPLEHEADRVADLVMRMPASVPRIVASAPGVQRAASHESAGPQAPAIVRRSLVTAGQPLDAATRAFFEPRFGRDFSAVRIHADGMADEASRSIAAHAFTLGSDIAFAQGRYDPARPAGRALLAHELAHVVQQSGGGGTVRRGWVDDPEHAGEEYATEKLEALANEPGPPSLYPGPSHCPPTFCQPFASKAWAAANLLWAGPVIVAGIAKYKGPWAAGYWANHLAGGWSMPNDLSLQLSGAFTASPTTEKIARFLAGALRRDVEDDRAALPSGASPVTVDFAPRLSMELAAIDTPGSAFEMGFVGPNDIAANLAGRIGKDQAAFPIGANPSRQDDAREAIVTATLTDNPDGSTTVDPAITFTVYDTIDLCPGDCGAPNEQAATIPLSRFEATGLAGDLPFIVRFSAPDIDELKPFTIAPPARAPAP